MGCVKGILLDGSGRWLDFIAGGTIVGVWVIILLFCVGFCCFWGWATKKIMQTKGYNGGWFWFGFFFHVVALVIVLILPSNQRANDTNGLNVNRQFYGPQEYNPYASVPTRVVNQEMQSAGDRALDYEMQNVGNRAVKYEMQNAGDSAVSRFTWKCYRCGSLNESYVQTCRCGVTKMENVKSMHR